MVMERSAVVPVPADVVGTVRDRLQRSSSQVAAVERMLVEGRDCSEVVGQLSAAISALEHAGFALLAGGVGSCLEEPPGPRSEAARKLFERLLLRLG